MIVCNVCPRCRCLHPLCDCGEAPSLPPVPIRVRRALIIYDIVQAVITLNSEQDRGEDGGRTRGYEISEAFSFRYQ